MNEADTCRKFVVPLLQAAGWDDEPHSIAEQRSITDGRIVPVGRGFVRKPPKRVDYLLRATRDLPLAVVEAKAGWRNASDGIQQAREYAEMMGLKFAFATNGHEIIEIDYFTGAETVCKDFPTPDKLLQRYCAGSGVTSESDAQRLLEPYNLVAGKPPRYYQRIAIDRVVEAVLGGRTRLLLTLATGTGKTSVAFQICWKLWTTRWNRSGEPRRPKILFLADRNFLVDDPMAKDFAPFGDARHKIESGEVVQGRDMYFAIYQAMAEDERREGLFRKYPRDFFDLIVVDECHRGSARADSAWRDILNHFEPAAQLGMTATPLREDSRDTYLYFGNPLYTYTLQQGIADGFLAPYRVHRVISEWDAAGWRPNLGEVDRYGRTIPDDEYQTNDFERAVALKARTNAIARHLTDFLRKTDRYAKTIVFCVDQEHAAEMRAALVALNQDLIAQHSDYVCRVTADEGDVGAGHRGRFQDPENRTPVILTSSQLLTTGLDAPTCKNVVLARVVGSMSEFKQIIGRGTRVKDDYGKLWFNIIDYTGSATRLFADPAFDGEPARVTQEEIDAVGLAVQPARVIAAEAEPADYLAGIGSVIQPDDAEPRRKFYFDGGHVEIAAHLVYELDSNGSQLRVVRYADYAAESVRLIVPSAPELRRRWAEPVQRTEIIEALNQRGIDFTELSESTGQPEADPFDLLCHLAFNAPLRTRRERALALKRERPDFWQRFSPEARNLLEELLEKYAEHGDAQFVLPDVLRVPPISGHGQPAEIIRLFGSAEQLRAAVTDLQNLLYAS
ncbi:EcoAI/FtnUII family type I restriction enzme subunit R [Variovorax sp. EBFNA2]|uniref:EcoAI/FtnUII family type I restriction enzme subunit R n=1 Tax=Variovorax sp. EBFNA2 TaxID=3342097 RepID=UPI0029C03E6A|nr:DEAD/DEAH box helicase family protein [Variovorax boronicumulans]WPG36743.1 DEAD/DEAH box helicase family protein [Variovorax boronicumulans]